MQQLSWQQPLSQLSWWVTAGPPAWHAAQPVWVFLIIMYVFRCCCCSCILAVICGMTLLMTSCRDPGILPRQEPDEEWLQARKPRCAGTAITACSVHTHAAQQCTLPLHAAHAAMQAMSTAVNAGTVRSTHSHVAHQHSSVRCHCTQHTQSSSTPVQQ
jgi:hypothetical protein